MVFFPRRCRTPGEPAGGPCIGSCGWLADCGPAPAAGRPSRLSTLFRASSWRLAVTRALVAWRAETSEPYMMACGRQ